MAHYTITIKKLIDNNFDFKMTNYPIFDEGYRNTLNNNILNHYLMDEIGFETEGLFRHYLNQKLNEIMPYYNELYKAQKELIDKKLILNNVNITETFERKNDTKTKSNSNSNSTSNSTTNNKNLYQDTPSGQLKSTDIENAKWATNLTLDKNSSNNNVEDTSVVDGTANNTENYLKTIIGNNGSKFNIDLLTDIKNNLMKIDLMIINELQDLFMGIY